METSYGERRDYNRIPLEADVQYAEFKDGMQKRSQNYEKVKIKNISKRGICIKASKCVEQETVLDIELFLKKKVIRSLGEVKYCKQNSKEGHYEIGVNFISLKANDIIFLEEFVEEHSIRRHDFFERE